MTQVIPALIAGGKFKRTGNDYTFEGKDGTKYKFTTDKLGGADFTMATLNAMTTSKRNTFFTLY